MSFQRLSATCLKRFMVGTEPSVLSISRLHWNNHLSEYLFSTVTQTNTSTHKHIHKTCLRILTHDILVMTCFAVFAPLGNLHRSRVIEPRKSSWVLNCMKKLTMDFEVFSVNSKFIPWRKSQHPTPEKEDLRSYIDYSCCENNASKLLETLLVFWEKIFLLW